MEKTRNRREPISGRRPESPNLVIRRTESRISNASAPPDLPPLTPSSIKNISNTYPRSRSTTKPRTINKSEETKYGFSQRQYTRNSSPDLAAAKAIEMAKSKRNAKSLTKSPSAWALSPGRSPSSPLITLNTEPFILGGGGSGNLYNKAGGYLFNNNNTGGPNKVKSSIGSGAVSGVLKYFRSSKKVSYVQEEAFHRFRVLHTRLMQWRVVNARVQTAMAKQNSIAEAKLFNVWLRIHQMRNSVVEKRIQVQKLKQEVKLLQIINPEINLLVEWSRIEKRNSEAVARLAKSLSVLSIRLPITQGAKVDMVSFYKSMRSAINVMNNIEETIVQNFFEVEETSLLLEELMETIRQERKDFEELRKIFAIISSLEAQEESLRVFVMQASKDRLCAAY